jgi:FdhE protein
MTMDRWLTKHPYLRGIANLQKVIEQAAAEVVIPTAGVPRWTDYIVDFNAGLPLLLSPTFEIDVRTVASALRCFVEKVNSKMLPPKVARETWDLVADLQSDPNLPYKTISWLLGKGTFAPGHAGLLRYLGWTVLAKHLSALTLAFSHWRQQQRWLLNYCPLCGELPMMAQLVGDDLARLRLLSCGCCQTRWCYRRTGCPFCDTNDDRRLTILSVEGEDALRIDRCDNCGGYLKTYTGQGNEAVLLADWTSLHLDVLARDRGLKSFAASLYQF